MTEVRYLGIDIGGTLIKAALVDVQCGQVTQRLQVPTPKPSTFEALQAIISSIGERLKPTFVGIGFPGVVVDSTIYTAPNLHPSCVGVHLSELYPAAVGLNDADAAGLAEMHFGIGQNLTGTTLLLTLGTGIGSALFHDTTLVPNTELGHLWLPGGFEAETRLSAAAKVRDGLSFETWTHAFNAYIQYLYALFRPQRFIVTGGICAQSAQWRPLIQSPVPVHIARLPQDAGILGAAYYAHSQLLP